MRAAGGLLRSTPSSPAPSSTTSIHRLGSRTCSHASTIMLSRGWLNYCRGTGESLCRAMSKRREPRGHMRASGLSAADKSAVTPACQQLIDGFLKPRFMLTIRPTQFNYPVDILGKWHGTKYRFIQRYRGATCQSNGGLLHSQLARTLAHHAQSHRPGRVTEARIDGHRDRIARSARQPPTMSPWNPCILTYQTSTIGWLSGQGGRSAAWKCCHLARPLETHRYRTRRRNRSGWKCG